MTGKLDKTTDITTYGVGREKSRRTTGERNATTRRTKQKCLHNAGIFDCLAERAGRAYIPQAAVAHARATLRVPPEAAQAASST
ncbi:hypothetical protein, partial [Burkholderia aenigmatica]|uniref:hypothetical protein n=1 Tax=Burkholderia aenigmatica TaxID=2015348 RepID=UPI0028D36410